MNRELSIMIIRSHSLWKLMLRKDVKE